jgi:glycogen operon protein
VNFSVFAKGCDHVELLLFEGANSPAPARVIPLDPHSSRTYHYWHTFVDGVGPGQVYAFRADGPFNPARGLRFDVSKTLLDPYGRAVACPAERSRDDAAVWGRENASSAFRSVVVQAGSYDWEDDRPPRHAFERLVIYVLHVGAFTRHPSSGVPEALRGTFAGTIEKIPHLKDLGLTAVELLPVFAFDDRDATRGRRNVWGYAPISFFAPHWAYSARETAAGVLDEFRDMVKSLHRAGIEVLLDVVYNHTAEGNADGPTISFRGLSNSTYYMLDHGEYSNYSGCGNTLNANDPIVRRLILDSLKYWVEEMHVDGFRFDLASILTRDSHGYPMAAPPVLWDIESDPVLANVKLIAEAWDAGGLDQVGNFVGESWKEWNGKYRDDVRAFVRGDPGMVGAVAARLLGSPDLYGHQGREPEQSVNFVTCHDGFTLNDLVSFDRKHNEPNGEENRDGTDDNRSWNCGVEGPSDDPAIDALRTRQIKNMLTLLFASVGTPMLLMGDEVRRTQRGNNNAYCRDDDSVWFDWALVERHADLLRFARTIIALRRDRPLANDRSDVTLSELLHLQSVAWHGVRPHEPDWSFESRSLALTIPLADGTSAVHVIANAYWEPLVFSLPAPPARAEPWRRLVDTALPSPEDAIAWTRAPVVSTSSYEVCARSVVLLGALGTDAVSGGS